jgi:hypothetical protein
VKIMNWVQKGNEDSVFQFRYNTGLISEDIYLSELSYKGGICKLGNITDSCFSFTFFPHY